MLSDYLFEPEEEFQRPRNPQASIHETARAREIALSSTILRVQVGSGLHGTNVLEQDDRDEMGVCIEPPSCVIGLEKFEQYQDRRHADGSRIGDGERSGPGDLDLVIYSLRKWSKLAADGNPTVLLLLFAPPQEWVVCNSAGMDLQQAKDLFLSKQCGERFLGYLHAQKERMLGLRSPHTNRPELIEVYGFDTKFAYHAVRLGLQGVELLSTGHITLPIPGDDRQWLRDLRVGKYTKEEALDRVDDLQDELRRLMLKVDLPDRPDYDKLNAFLTSTYQEWWSQC